MFDSEMEDSARVDGCTRVGARTMPAVMAMFFGQFAIEYRLPATGLIVGVMPPVILALHFQKFITSELTQGGMKG